MKEREALVAELAPLRVNAQKDHPWAEWANWEEREESNQRTRTGSRNVDLDTSAIQHPKRPKQADVHASDSTDGGLDEAERIPCTGHATQGDTFRLRFSCESPNQVSSP